MIAQTDPFTPASEPMHAKSAKARSAYLSMLSKDNESHRAITDNYVRFWEEGGHEKANTEEEVAARKDSYMSLVNKSVSSKSLSSFLFRVRAPFMVKVETDGYLDGCVVIMTLRQTFTRKPGASTSISADLPLANQCQRLLLVTSTTSRI